jgi:hypothetical protein
MLSKILRNQGIGKAFFCAAAAKALSKGRISQVIGAVVDV